MSPLSDLPHPDLADRFRAVRSYDGAASHLDSAAAGRMSEATIEAVTGHLRAEARRGAYVAYAAAADTVEEARDGLAGLLGRGPDDLAFTESATAALTGLLLALQLPRGAEVWVAPGEYGPNLGVLAAFGLRTTPMPVADEVGHLDVEALRAGLRSRRPALLHLCYHGSHRGVVQPAREAVAAARDHGVPVVVDAAQGAGHLDCALDADAVYATSRKWLCGPRGVGFLVARPGFVPGGVRAVESSEASVAGRAGLANAVREHLGLGPERVRERLRATGAAVRRHLDGAGGWRVVEPAGEPSAVTTLLPPDGWADDATARLRDTLVREAGIVTTFAAVERAPLEAKRGALRVSPHLDTTAAQVGELRDALVAATP